MENRYLYTLNDDQDLFDYQRITFDEISEIVSKADTIYFDTETTGLSPIDNKVLLLQLSTGEVDIVIDALSVNLEDFAELFNSDAEKLWVAHNAKFDRNMLWQYGIKLNNVFCTSVAERVIHCGKTNPKNSGKEFKSSALKDTLLRRFGIEMSKDIRSSFIGFSGSVFSKTQLEYATEDSRILKKLKEAQEADIKALSLHNTIKLEMKVLTVFADMELLGMGVDKDAWIAYSEEFEQEMSRLEQDLNELIKVRFPEYIKPDLFIGDKVDINWGSSAQVRTLLKKIDPRVESSNEETLLGIDDPIAEKILEYRKAYKNANTYGRSFLEHKVTVKKKLGYTSTQPSGLHKDGKFHSNYQTVVDSGRCSSSNPNFQNIPSGTKHRSLFRTPTPGYKYLIYDYSGQELAVMAYASGQQEWIDILRDGGDLHTENAKKIFGKDTITKEERNQCKALTFGVCYGKGAYSFAKDLDITEDEAQTVLDKYFEAFPNLEKWLKKNRSTGINYGQVRTLAPVRRLRSFPNWRQGIRGADAGRIGRMSMNSPVQGTGSDIIKLSMIFLHEKINEDNLPMDIVAQVHDELLVECSPDFVEEGKKIVEKAMTDAADAVLGKGLLKADGVVSSTWIKG